MLKPLTSFALMVMAIFSLISSSSCTMTPKDYPFGIQEEHSGYVPARIAVLPCRSWPNGARYATLPLSNSKELQQKSFCEKYDEFVLGGFKDQPYMRGFSPKWVKKLLEDNKKPKHLAAVDKIWGHQKDDCRDCVNTPSFYILSIQDRESWRVWLGEFSKSVRNADAILVPFLDYSVEQSYIDRGLKVMKRSGQVTLFLIDTNNGYLLWAGGRRSNVTNQEAPNQGVKKELIMPTWESLYERILVEDVWKDFPGRQVYK